MYTVHANDGNPVNSDTSSPPMLSHCHRSSASQTAIVMVRRSLSSCILLFQSILSHRPAASVAAPPLTAAGRLSPPADFCAAAAMFSTRFAISLRSTFIRIS